MNRKKGPIRLDIRAGGASEESLEESEWSQLCEALRGKLDTVKPGDCIQTDEFYYQIHKKKDDRIELARTFYARDRIHWGKEYHKREDGTLTRQGVLLAKGSPYLRIFLGFSGDGTMGTMSWGDGEELEQPWRAESEDKASKP